MSWPHAIPCRALFALLALLGCASNTKNPATVSQRVVDPKQVQSETMAFANRYIAATADMYTRIQKQSSSTDVKLAAVRGKLVAATGAIANAVELNPLVGLMDMAVMVKLNRMIVEQRPWVRDLFGPENTEMMLAVLKAQEQDIWNAASFYLTPEQMTELHKLCEQWLQEHPEQRFVMDVRLTDFNQADQTHRGGIPLVGSVFRLVTLDPFGGLDPAVREVEQSRFLAERMFFYLRSMPTLVAWQTDSLYMQMLQAPEAKQLLANTSTLTGSTTRFSEIADKFANTIEKFRVQLSQQQSQLVDDLNKLVATQRDAALRQATTQVSLQRDEAIKQINATFSGQQELLTGNLRSVMNSSIDRLYSRAMVLVLTGIVAALVAFLVYHLIVASSTARVRARKEQAQRF